MRTLKNLLVSLCCFIVTVAISPTLFAQHSNGNSTSATKTVELVPETSDIMDQRRRSILTAALWPHLACQRLLQLVNDK
jgi:hypothetical protein